MRPFRLTSFVPLLILGGLLAFPLLGMTRLRGAEAPADPAEALAGHLAAGEFGPALKIANSVDDPDLQADLFSQIVAAEVHAGEYEAAGILASRFIREDEQGEKSDSKPGSQSKSLASGGRGLMMLRMLIQRVTDGEWKMMSGGTGGSIMNWGMANRNPAGVYVNASGQLATLSKVAHGRHLRDLGIAARVPTLNEEMAEPVSMRVVSLRRLEEAVARRLEDGQYVPASMTNLAGLTRVRYVFLDREHNDILLAGPAEGWRIDETGRAVGRESGRPVLQLDDLVTLLRTFSPHALNAFQCSIEPRPEGVHAVQAYVAARARHPLSAGAGVRRYVRELGERLGKQDVFLQGVPANSRIARVIVEADYRMKLVGIDKLDLAELPSYFDLLGVTPGSGPVATKALRWWLTTNYDAILHSRDKTAFEFVGPSVKCLSENEFFNEKGERIGTGRSEQANRLFAQKFTQGFAKLAKVDPTFADLRNVFDLALASALIRAEGLDHQAHWDRGVFAKGGAYETTKYVPIETVATVANHRVYHGTDVVVQVAGGVRGDLLSLLADSSIYRQAIRAGEVVGNVFTTEPPAERWWWDVESSSSLEAK